MTSYISVSGCGTSCILRRRFRVRKPKWLMPTSLTMIAMHSMTPAIHSISAGERRAREQWGISGRAQNWGEEGKTWIWNEWFWTSHFLRVCIMLVTCAFLVTCYSIALKRLCAQETELLQKMHTRMNAFRYITSVFESTVCFVNMLTIKNMKKSIQHYLKTVQ